MVFFNIFEKHSNGMDHLVIEKIIGKEVTKVINLTKGVCSPLKKGGALLPLHVSVVFLGMLPIKNVRVFSINSKSKLQIFPGLLFYE